MKDTRGRPAARWVASLALLLLACQTCMAARHALLVGVSAYPRLAPHRQLLSPANDVRLMRDVLVQRGFDPRSIDVVANQVTGGRQPTRAAILEALDALAKRTVDGDLVYLHFSGHGSLQRRRGSGTGSAEWQPVFLPQDVGPWTDGQSRIPNAVTDVELRERIDRMTAAGVFVFAVFDACHSANLVRGRPRPGNVPEVRVRHVPPEELGVVGVPGYESQPDPFGRTGTTKSVRTDGRPARGRAVYFYAAQSMEVAMAFPLPNGGSEAWYGLFTWHLAQALKTGQASTYAQLGDHILSRLDRLPAAAATPLYSGDGLDQAVFEQPTRAVRQWRLEQDASSLTIAAGALSELAVGAVFALLSDPLVPGQPEATRPPPGTLGFARLVELGPNRAVLEPVAWQGWAAPSSRSIGRGVWARLMVNPPVFALRVAVDPGVCGEPCIAAQVLSRLQRDGVPGVDVQWVHPAAAAEARLRADAGELQLWLPGHDGWEMRDRWATNGSVTAPGSRLEVMVQEIGESLHRVARTRNLLALASAMALRDRPAELGVTVKVVRTGSRGPLPTIPGQMQRVGPGDRILLDVRNNGADPVDVAAFWIGADHRIERLYPVDRGKARIVGKEAWATQEFEIGHVPDGIDRLLILSLPMRPNRPISDFALLEQAPLSRQRGTADPALQALLDACFAEYRLRGELPSAPVEQLGLWLYTFRVGR